MKIDRGVTNCLARWGLNETDLYVLHWSGLRKPFHQQTQQTQRTQRTQQNQQQRGSSSSSGSGSRSGSGSGERDSEGEDEGARNSTTEATFARLYRDSYFYWADELVRSEY